MLSPDFPEDFWPDFSQGLLPVIAQDSQTGLVLMLAWINEEAFKLSLEKGEAYYWSRSRAKIWHKGESSGHVQKLQSVRLDCDNDAILFLVSQRGGACHTGHQSCFFREWKNGQVNECSGMTFDPAMVYGHAE